MAQFGHLISGAAWSVAGKVFQFLLGLVTLAAVARLVGPEAYGIYALAWLAVGIFEILVGGAPVDTLIQRRVATPGHFNATFWASLALSLLGLALLWSTADVLAGWLSGGAMLAAILPVRAFVFVFRAVATGPTATLMRASRFPTVAKAEMLASIVGNMVGLGMAFGGFGIWSLVGMELARAAALTTTLYLASGWRPGVRMRFSDFTDLLAFNASTWGSWGLNYVENQMPRFVIASALGPHAVGYYALAQRLCDQVCEILMAPAYNVVQAGVARAQDDIRNARRLAQGTLRITAVIACPLFLGLAALAPVLVPTVFGPEWIEAVPVVALLMLLGIRASMSTIHAAVIRGMGKAHWEMAGAALSAGMSLTLVTLAAPHGLLHAAAAVVIGAWLAWPLDAWFVRRLTGLPFSRQGGSGTRASVSGLAMALAVVALTPPLVEVLPGLAVIALLVPLGAVIYWAMLSVLMPAAAEIIGRVVLALVRRDLGAVRNSFASLGT